MTVLLTLFRSFLLSLIIFNPSLAYQELSLKPVQIKNQSFNRMQLGRTYNYHEGSRILAAKEANFPILEQYEALLFPQKKELFIKEKPKARLERIEIAVHGNIQKGSVKHRLNLLENEITAWQIANYQTLQILDTKAKNPNAFSYPEKPIAIRHTRIRQNNQQQRATSINNRQYTNQTKPVDYDYQNYRLVSPILRDVGRRSIRALFEN
jgi:hypothetical protein